MAMHVYCFPTGLYWGLEPNRTQHERLQPVLVTLTGCWTRS